MAQIFTNAPRENLNILSLFVGHPTFNLSPQVRRSSDSRLPHRIVHIFIFMVWYGVACFGVGVAEAAEIHSCVSIIYIQIKTKTPKGNLCQGSRELSPELPHLVLVWQMMSLLPFSCGAALCLFWHLDYMDLRRCWPINYPDIWHMYMGAGPMVVVAPVKIADRR